MTVTTSELRKGLTIQMDGELYKVTDWAHNKQGRGSAQVRLQLKSLRTGSNIERSSPSRLSASRAARRSGPAAVESAHM